MFESGEVKFVILRLLNEKPRHGYEVIRALEEKFGGLYTPSPGTVYPTLQLLEDEGYVKVIETDGKKVYHVTPEGAKYLEEHRGVLDEIFDRVRETVREFTGGSSGDMHQAFAHLAAVTFKRAWRRGPEDPRSRAWPRFYARPRRTSRKRSIQSHPPLTARPDDRRRDRCSDFTRCSG